MEIKKKRFISIIMAIIIVCSCTVNVALASGAEASELDFSIETEALAELANTTSVTVSYNRSAAVAYAKKFGGIPEGTNNGIFKSRGLDCTNFVSQCLWADYGGTKGLPLTQTEKLSQLVYENYRQTSTWMGRSVKSPYDYPTGLFMRVVELWDYITTNTGHGPRATGYNNNKLWTQIPVVPQTGDIIQIYMGNKYGHSVIVSEVNSTGLSSTNPYSWLDRVYVSQHTYNTARRSLRDLVNLHGGTGACKIRLIRPKTTTFVR